jgi:hypothetical protein
LFEFREIERLGFFTEGGSDGPKINAETEQENEPASDWNEEFRFGKPAAMEILNRRARELGNWHAGRLSVKRLQELQRYKKLQRQGGPQQLLFVTM